MTQPQTHQYSQNEWNELEKYRIAIQDSRDKVKLHYRYTDIINDALNNLQRLVSSSFVNLVIDEYDLEELGWKKLPEIEGG